MRVEHYGLEILHKVKGFRKSLHYPFTRQGFGTGTKFSSARLLFLSSACLRPDLQ